MKRILYASFFAACAALSLSSCMNGDYDADPNTASTTTNPLNENKNNNNGGNNNNSFNWSGSEPMSCKIDGAGWQAQRGEFDPELQGFPAQVTGYGSDKSAIVLTLPVNPTINTTYSFGSNLSAVYLIDITAPAGGTNEFTAALGGNGQIMITENDATHIKGKFFFSGKNTAGASRTINEGYFDVKK